MIEWRRMETWDPYVLRLIRAHYTGSGGPPPGKKMCWVAKLDQEPIALFGLGEPAFKLAPRRRLGLADARPLPETVCCFIYRRISSAGPTGSELITEWHEVAGSEWGRQYGWEPVHWETLVLPGAVASKVPGACFRRAGYRSCGMTTGRGGRRPPGSTHGPRVWVEGEPKLLLYRGPLCRVA